MLQRIQSLERMVRWLYCKVKNTAIGGIQSIIAGDNITIDNTDPLNPVVSSTGGGGGDSDTIAKTIEVTLDDLEVATEEEVTEQIIADYFNSLGLVKSEKDFYIIKLIPTSETEYNFDVTGGWETFPITDSASFQLKLENMGFTGVTVSDFSLINGRLQANVTRTGGVSLVLSGLLNTDVKVIAITELQTLSLDGNNIVNFNPSIPLPNTLQNLYLDGNQIETFNPSIPLPNTLQTLSLDGNQIETFNPSIPLPIGLQTLYLSNNYIFDWSLLEDWANSLPNGTTNIRLDNNPTSSEGTTLKSILIAKGYTVYS